MPAAPDHSAEPSSTTPGSAPDGQTPLFHERVMPGPGLWIAAVTLGAALGLILVPLSLPAAIAVGAAAIAGLLVLVVAYSPVLEVADGRFRMHRAEIQGVPAGEPAARQA